MQGPFGRACRIATALLVLSTPATADAEEARGETIERDGRGMIFGVSGAFLLGATALTPVEAPEQPSLQPGWSSHGRFGLELPPGIAVSLVAGGGGIAAVSGAPPLFLRALVDVRYTLDLGAVRPFVSAGAGFLLVKAGPNLRATFTAEASVGLDIPLAPWAAIEASVGAELVAPGDALREVMIFAMLPRVGVGFHY